MLNNSNYKNFGVFLVFLVIMLAFFAHTFYGLDRMYVEAFAILISLIILIININKNIIFIILIFGFQIALRAIYHNDIIIGFYDLAVIPILIYYSKISIKIEHIEKIILVLAIIQLLTGLYCVFNELLVDGGRIGGIFPSSMHFGFATAGLAFANYMTRGNNLKIFISVILLISALLSGSRAAALCSIIFLFLSIYQIMGFVKSSIFIVLIFLFAGEYLLDSRAISHIEYSDSGRVESYVDWLNRVDFTMLLLGDGRYFLGSVGGVGLLESRVTESSVLTFVEAYGLVISLIFIIAPYLKFKKIENMMYMNKFCIIFLFYFLASISPFFETPSILLVNSLLLTLVINANLIQKKDKIINL